MTETALKHISVRGVDATTYDEFSNRIKELEMNLGEAITKMMEQVLEDFDETFPEISSQTLRELANLNKGKIQHQKRLKITKQDLLDADTRYSIQHVDNLEFAEDVDAETFEKYIRHIQHCRTVRLPNILPKLKILSYISHCDNVEQYDVEEAEE